MALIEVSDYLPDQADAWNSFVARAKNATFLFDRRFMDYHSERFADNSLIFTDNGNVIALLPANLSGATLLSHGGLTYGGFITDARMSAVRMLDVFAACIGHLRHSGIRTLVYKPVPHFYHTLPAEEDIYALHRFGASLIQVDASAAIPVARRPKFAKSKQNGVKSAKRAGLVVRESFHWEACWGLLCAVLAERHGTTPTHSLSEIMRLASAFPDRIRLFAAYREDEMVSGVVVFDCTRTVHVQYIASNQTGRDHGGVDLIVDHLLCHVFPDRDWLDFGISTEANSSVLNAGLANQKEMFGARTVVYQRYSVDI
jgi:hypothetical protein